MIAALEPGASLYSAAQTRRLDGLAIQTFGIPGYELMTRAGAVAFDELTRRWPEHECLRVICGTGNNGGDGYVLARLALAAGTDVIAFTVGDSSRVRGDARNALDDYVAAGGEIRAFQGQDLAGAGVIVDAVFGTGLDREVTGAAAQAIGAMNESGSAVLALDIPSGLNSDTGVPMGGVVGAHCTVTFVGRKAGLFTGWGPAYCGDIVFSDLGLPAEVYHGRPCVGRLSPAYVPLPPRGRCAHKGESGHVLVVGGNRGFAGAARLAGEAALRAGAGLVTVAVKPENVNGIVAARPELMAVGVCGADDLEPLLRRADVVAIGPGLGLDDWAKRLHARVLAGELPQVVDADALTLLAREPVDGGNRILTPHPGEAARLLGVKSAAIQSDRFHAVGQLQARFGGVVVLKGSGTIVASPQAAPSLCPFGNPGLAVGGSGDVLTGVIAALIAQGLNMQEAAIGGVCLHAQAGDLAATPGERGMLPSDLMVHIRRLASGIARFG